MISLRCQALSSFWYTIPDTWAFCLHFITHHCQMPTTAPDIISSFMVRKRRGERGAALFFYRWRKNTLRRPPVDFPLRLIDHNLLTWAYLPARNSGKAITWLFQPPYWREARGRNGIYIHLYMYVYTHAHRHVYICSLFLMGKDSRSICVSLGTLPPFQLIKEIQAFILS